MNCKPGDLAIRIKGEEGSSVPLGAVVRCLKFFAGPSLATDQTGGFSEFHDLWTVDWNGKTHGESGYRLGVPDSHLRPIRDPGEDAQDETLNWLPVPSLDEVAA